MGHHGSEPSDEMLNAMRALHDANGDEAKAKEQRFLKAALEPKEGFGATGQYPMGKLDKTDEGEIQFGVTSHRGKVIINFGKPVAWLGMDGAQAIALAKVLIEHAARCRDIGDEQRSEARAKEHAGS